MTIHQNIFHQIPYSAKQWRGKTLVNLANPKQFAKVLPIQIYILKTADSRLPNNWLGNNSCDVSHEILSYFEGEARSPRSQCPIKGNCAAYSNSWSDRTWRSMKPSMKRNWRKMQAGPVERTHFWRQCRSMK